MNAHTAYTVVFLVHAKLLWIIALKKKLLWIIFCRNFHLQRTERRNKASWSGDIKAALVLVVVSGKDTGKKVRKLSSPVTFWAQRHVVWKKRWL